MVDVAERGVVFVLKVTEDEQAADIMKKFGARLGKLDSKRIEATNRRQQTAANTQTNLLRETLQRQNAAVMAAAAAQDRAVVESTEVQKKVREKQTKDFEREAKKQAQIVQDTKAKIDASSSRMSEGLASLASGITAVGQGWAYLGISSKESSEEMIKALLKVQGVIQIAKGGVDIYKGITRAVAAYREAILTATAARKALTAAEAVGAFAGGAGTTAAGRGGGVVSSIVSGGAGSAAVQVPLAAKALGGFTAVLRTATVALGSVPAVIASWGAAGAMAADVGGIRTRTAGRWSQSGFAQPESMIGSRLSSDWFQKSFLASMTMGVSNFLPQPQGPQGGLRTSEATAGRIEQRLQIERDFAAILPRLIADSVKASAAESRMTRPEVAGKIGELEKQRADMLGRGGIQPTAAVEIESQIAAYRDVGLEILQKEIDAAEKRRDVSKRESQERLRTADELIQKDQAQLDIQTRMIEQQRGILQSAAERFALANPEEQRALIQLKERATKGEKLTAEEYAKLSGVGTAKARELGGAGLRRIAEERGFGRAFGEEERAAIATAERERERLKLEIKDQREIKVQIQTENDNLIKQIGEEIRKIEAEQRPWLEARIRDEARRTFAEIRRERNNFQSKLAAIHR